MIDLRKHELNFANENTEGDITRTLEQYLIENYEEGFGITDWSLKIGSGHGKKLHIYIHPTNKSGETIDFIVKGNELEFLHSTNKER